MASSPHLKRVKRAFSRGTPKLKFKNDVIITFSVSQCLQCYATDALVDNSRNLFVLNWLRDCNLARSNNGADSIMSVGFQLVCKNTTLNPDKQQQLVNTTT